MKRLPGYILLTLIIAVSSLAASAQNTISPEKKKLIGELIVVMKIDTQMSQMTNLLMGMSDTMFAASVKQQLDKRTDLTQNEKDKLEAAIIERSTAFSAKFRERLPATINFTEFIDQTVYPLYDKAFTEKELADLVAFYKSDTGQKVLTTMPQLMADSIEMAQKHLVPKLTKLVDDILAEDMTELKHPPAAKKN